jgi:hypothetical protein
MLSLKSESVSCRLIRCALLAVLCLASASSAIGQISTSTNASLAPSPVDLGTTPVATVTVSASDGSKPNSSVTCAIQTRGHNASYSATLQGGVASISLLSIAQDPVGSYTLACSYAGSSNYAASSANTISFSIISPISTTTTVSVAPSPVTYGSSPVASVTVTASDGTIPTGSVSCNIQTRGHNAAYSSALTNGSASVPLTSIAQDPVGTYSFVCSYAGYSSYTASSSSTISLNVTKAVPVITWLPPASIAAGTALSTTQLDATASVGGDFTYIPAAGSVPAPGPDTLSVTFTPTDMTDYTTATKTVNLTVTSPLIATSLVVTSSSNPSNFGVPVAFTATVTSADGSTPTGIVTFTAGTTTVGGSMLRAGAGSVATSTLAPGTYTVTATYSGDATHASASATLASSQTVQNTPPVTSLILSPAQALSGDEITALVSETTAPGLQPQGSVTCTSPGITSVTQPLAASGATSLLLQSLPIGSDLVTCTFTSSIDSTTSSTSATAAIVAIGSSSAGSMTTSRNQAFGAILPDGNVVIAGGVAVGQYLNASLQTADLYNVSSGSFTPTGQLNVPRQSANAVTLSDGSFLVSGGISVNTIENTAEYYDPASSTFKSVGDMTSARFGHTATLLNNGQVLLAGGDIGSSITLSAELYSPASTSFAATGSMITSRVYGAAALLSNGSVLVVGGTSDNSQGNTVGLNKAELYNPTTSTFSAAPNMPFGAEGLTATPLPDGTILIAGGDAGNGTVPTASAAIYDPAANTFTSVGSMNTARTLHTATLLGNGLVLIAGGYTGSQYTNPTSSLELYDPSARTFSNAGNMTIPRVNQTATLLKTNAVLFAGGTNANGPTASAELYSFDVPEGLVDLKYLVVGITYAPPGSKSTVTYGSSSTLTYSSTVSAMTATTASLTLTETARVGLTVGGAVQGKNSFSATTSYGYNSTSSTMSVVANTAQNSIIAAGPTSSGIGVDHDYDIIYIWLNPQIDLSFPKLAYPTVNWSGLSYQGCDTTHVTDCDPNNIGNPDIVGIPVLCLKDPYLSPYCTQWHTFTDRAWDTSGKGGLTLTDYQTILAKDPFIANPNYNPANDTSGLVTEANGSLDYPIPAPGQGSQTYTGGVSTQTTNTGSQTIQRQYGVSFTIDTQLSGTFIVGFGQDIKSTVGNTWTQTDVTSNATTNQSAASYQITSPAATDNYAGPIVFDVWHDNYYGSFIFYSPDSPTIPAATITSNNSAVNFGGTIPYGNVSATQTVTLTNNSSVPMMMSTTSFAPFSTAVTFSTGSFSIVADQCSGVLLQAGQSCNVSIRFSPVLTDLQPTGSTVVNGTMIVSGVEIAPESTNVLITTQIPLSGTGTI